MSRKQKLNNEILRRVKADGTAEKLCESICVWYVSTWKCARSDELISRENESAYEYKLVRIVFVFVFVRFQSDKEHSVN